MDHFGEAESKLETRYVDGYGRRTDQIDALTHAVLALVERLDCLPVMGIQLGELEEDDEDYE